MKKIAIDTGPLRSGDSVRGVGVYTRELLDSLQEIKEKDFEIEPVDYFGGRLFLNPKSLFLNQFDIIHFTRFNPFRISLPFEKPKGVKFVLTIYDLIPIIYPKHYPPGFKGLLNWQINKFLIKKYVDSIITISETSKEDICRFIGVNPNKVFVTYLAPRSIFKKLDGDNWQKKIRQRYNLPPHFALYVGDINYNKNIPNLVGACKLAKIFLVIVGKQAKEIEKMDLNHPELLHLKEIDWTGVLRLGFVSDEDLVKIYNLADVYIQPSFYEGFGLPVLEAVACKTPIACSNAKALVEILGEDVSYFDPNNPRDMAEKISSSSTNIRLPFDYSWEETARATMSVYRSLMFDVVNKN